jgi:hypothetical protein
MLRYTLGLPLDSMLTTVQPLAAMNLETNWTSSNRVKIMKWWWISAHLHRSTWRILRDLEDGHFHSGWRGRWAVPAPHPCPYSKRYEPIDYTMSLGTITKVAMENLVAQMEEIKRRAAPAN